MPVSPRAICGACQVAMRPKKNGVVVEMMIAGGDGVPDRPYFKCEGDEWECPECKATVIIGMGQPIAEHWHPEYNEIEAADIQARFS